MGSALIILVLFFSTAAALLRIARLPATQAGILRPE